MSVSVVIPNWNGEDRLKRNIPHVLRVKDADEIIVVDDGSTDKSVELLKENFPQVKLIVQGKNRGFAVAVNKGVKETKGDLVFLLNSDALPDEDCIKEALPYLKDEKVFSVSCNTGGSWNWAKFDQGYFWHYMVEKVDEVHQTLYASGGSGIFRKEIWDELGGLDEQFSPFYEEDMDLGYRATKRGYINLWVKKSKVEHYKSPGVIKEHFSKEYISRIAQRNQLLFIWKNIHDKGMTREHIKALVRNLLSHPKYWRVFTAALVKLPEILKKRVHEEKASIFTDAEILNKFS